MAAFGQKFNELIKRKETEQRQAINDAGKIQPTATFQRNTNDFLVTPFAEPRFDCKMSTSILPQNDKNAKGFMHLQMKHEHFIQLYKVSCVHSYGLQLH